MRRSHLPPEHWMLQVTFVAGRREMSLDLRALDPGFADNPVIPLALERTFCRL
jgi:hypothetical protein